MSDIKRNYIYNVIYQLLVIMFPIITMPYISRIIGPNGIGIYSYTHSIVYYFVIISMLGINNYGNRSIAKVRENNKNLNKSFFEIYFIQFLMGVISLFIYICFLTFNDKYSSIFTIQILYLISCFFDINWFYFGIEKFKFTSVLNICVKIAVIVLLFLFVNSKDDLEIYTFIMTSSILISQLILWIPLHKYINIKYLKSLNIKFALKKHFVPCLKLFIPVIAVSLYKYMDKIMLGIMTTIDDVAIYENAEKVVNLPICLITALGTVMLPRISNISNKLDKEKMNSYLDKTLSFSMFLSFPISFGLISVANLFAPLFFGSAFIECGNVIKYLAITNVFVSWASVIRMQFLLPKEKDNIYIVSVLFGAIINFVLNLILIKLIGLIGAVLATIFAEFVVMFIQTYMIRREIYVKRLITNILPFFAKSLVMFLLIRLIDMTVQRFNISNIILLVMEILCGIGIYFALNIKYIMYNLYKFSIKRKEKI